MCIKMRKIIFRIDMTFLVHKSNEIDQNTLFDIFKDLKVCENVKKNT